jgi:hypothetical protein
VKEVVSQPADVLKKVEDYLRKLGRRAALRQLATELEKEMALERTAQLKVMEAEVEKLWVVSRKGDMAGITKLDAYHRSLETNRDRDMVSSDPRGT